MSELKSNEEHPNRKKVNWRESASDSYFQKVMYKVDRNPNYNDHKIEGN
jgi:hypothetical protein